jgi:class 3 adenylate cyclase
VCIQLRDVPRARELYELLEPYSEFVPIAGPASLCYDPVPSYLGRLAAVEGRHDLAVTHLERGLQKLERLGFGVFLVQNRLHLAETLRMRDDTGDRDRALSTVGEALAEAERLGMKPAVERALALKLDLQGTDFSGVNVKQSIYVVADAVEARKQDLVTHAAPDGTVTLLFSDMQGFTAMTEKLGDLKARDVIREHNQIVRTQLAAHGGYEVELQGDGFLLAFSSARQGLYCAIEIQRAFAARNLRQSENPIHVRIGVHTGEALKDADKFFGRSVILAARIADQAQGGEILSSTIVRELTSSTGDIRFGSEREVALKGIAAPQRLVQVDWQ